MPNTFGKDNYNGVFNYKRCGWVTIDVNGLQKPNTFGKDIYVLYIMDKAKTVNI